MGLWIAFDFLKKLHKMPFPFLKKQPVLTGGKHVKKIILNTHYFRR